EVERPLGEALPQALPIAPLTDRRSAFPGGGAVRNLLRGAREIVRARLGRDGEAGTPGVPRPDEGVGRGDTDRVNGAAVFAAAPAGRAAAHPGRRGPAGAPARRRVPAPLGRGTASPGARRRAAAGVPPCP